MLKILAAGMFLGYTIFNVAIMAGMRVNGTNSFPIGIYWTVSGLPKKGDLVFVKVDELPIYPDRAYMNIAWSPVRHLLKRLVGTPGDRVTINEYEVEINGVRVPNSAPLVRDGVGRPLAPWLVDNYILRADEVLIMSDVCPTSFDSRYFGPVPKIMIESVVIPIWTSRET